jgi:hypothetical protein
MPIAWLWDRWPIHKDKQAVPWIGWSCKKDVMVSGESWYLGCPDRSSIKALTSFQACKDSLLFFSAYNLLLINHPPSLLPPSFPNLIQFRTFQNYWFFFLQDLGLNSGFVLTKQMLYSLSHISNPENFFLYQYKAINWDLLYQIFAVLGLELRAYTESHSTIPFLWKVFSR